LLSPVNSLAGRIHTATGVVHIAVRRALFVLAGHRVPGAHRNLRVMARPRLRPSQLRVMERHHADFRRLVGFCAGHLHQRSGHCQVVPVNAMGRLQNTRIQTNALSNNEILMG